MKFKLKEKNGFFPDVLYGAPDVELGCFIPEGCSWAQVNYGQGEGQVIVDGVEWGFYYGDDDSLFIIMHEGDITYDEALKFVEQVSINLFKDKSDSVIITLSEA